MRPRDGQKLVHRQVRPFPGDIETGKETERWTLVHRQVRPFPGNIETGNETERWTKTGSQTGETIPWGH